MLAKKPCQHLTLRTIIKGQGHYLQLSRIGTRSYRISLLALLKKGLGYFASVEIENSRIVKPEVFQLWLKLS